MRVSIGNCNNIVQGDLEIEESKINIFYGYNGTGKTTISKVIEAKLNNDNLDIFYPYGNRNNQPSIDIDGIDSILTFNDEYVKRYVYQNNSVISNAFDIFIKDKDYLNRENKVKEDLKRLKAILFDDETIRSFESELNRLAKQISITKTNKLSKSGAMGKVVNDLAGGYLNPPDELKCFSEIYNDKNVTDWAVWRLKGMDNFGNKQICPYCSNREEKKLKEINKSFQKTFEKKSLEIATNIKAAIENLAGFIDVDKATIEIINSIGVVDKNSLLIEELTNLGRETLYLQNKIGTIRKFNGLDVSVDKLDELRNSLNNLKIDKSAVEYYFNQDKFIKFSEAINREIDRMLERVGALKGEINNLQKCLSEKIEKNKVDINNFLELAGYPYEFSIEVENEQEAMAVLKYKGDNHTKVDVPDKHLSWGERHAFALILFMFEAIRNKTSLVVLDDPISSFDNNKKYAIVKRLFQTGRGISSLAGRTVLLLTHDFEPILDFYKNYNEKQSLQGKIVAKYLSNEKGVLRICNINSEDIMSVVSLWKCIAKDDNEELLTRIGCLRKYIEHVDLNHEDSLEWNMLSSDIHNYDIPTKKNENNRLFTAQEKQEAEQVIRKYIPNYEYKNKTLDEILIAYNNTECVYQKMFILRVYTEMCGEARNRLKNSNNVLRKYIDELFHVENDYIYTLDIRKYDLVPDYILNAANEFMDDEVNLHD